MPDAKIACPKCGHEFELTEALSGRLREHLREELLGEITKREAAMAEKAQEFAAQREALQKERESLDEEVERKLKEKAEETRKKAEAKAREDFEVEMKSLKESLDEKSDALRELREKEVALRKEKAKLEESKEEMQLEVQRTLDEERAKIRDDAVSKAEEKHHLKDLEKDQKIKDLMSSLEEAQRKAEQGSMERQGEVLELNFEDRLRGIFAEDDIEPVPKGVKGADLLQKVRSPFGNDCGIIVWEIKNTKAWGGKWIPKLKEDMVAVRAQVAVLVSRVLPDGVKGFGIKDGVWVTEPSSAIALATALRHQLLAVEQERVATEGKSGKMEMLYRYLSGTEFRQHVEGIVEAFQAMQGQLARERRAMEKQWKEREKQIDRVMKNTVGMYGDMQGIIGGQLPEIAALELDEGDLKQLPE